MNDSELQARLAAAPRRIDPPADLWPGIDARIAGAGSRPVSRGLPRLAAVATLALAAGMALWVAAGLAPDQAPGLDRDGGIARVYADTIELTYAGPLRTLASDRRPAVPALDTGSMELSLRTLENAVEVLRAALEANPDAVYLAEMLENTHRQRLRMLRELALLGIETPDDRKTS